MRRWCPCLFFHQQPPDRQFFPHLCSDPLLHLTDSRYSIRAQGKNAQDNNRNRREILERISRLLWLIVKYYQTLLKLNGVLK